MGITLPGRFFLEGYIKKGIISGTFGDEIKYGRERVKEVIENYHKHAGSFTITAHSPSFPEICPVEGKGNELLEKMVRLYRIELQGNALATTETVRNFLDNELSDLETILGDEDGGPVKIRHYYLKEKR